jgi:pilus assembly protein FimV
MDLGAGEVRKISTTLALIGMFAPWSASPLGIGDIRLQSALNQALNAEIPLVSLDAAALADIRVTLASPEAFARAHIERNYQLTKLRFTIQAASDGGYVIKVSSKEPIREPFLNFMIEVYWPQGRLQREFTVLLDPPDSFQESGAYNQELQESETYAPPRVQAAQRPARQINAAHGQVRRSLSEGGRAVTKAEAGAIPVTGTHYGPVGRNETLWNIAKKYPYPQISQRQMLAAIYQANPQAFYQPSIDALKAGATLTIPDQASLARLVGAESSVRPTRNEGRLNDKAETLTEPALAKTNEKPGTQGQLQLLAPSESKSLAEAATVGKKGNSGNSKESLALELAETAKHESENFRKRLADVEQQMATMQRLLILKDEQIASLQAQKKPAEKAGQQSDSPSPAQPPVETPQPAPAPPPVAALRPASPPRMAAVPAPAPQKPVEPTPPVNDAGIVEGLLTQPYYLVGGATGLLLLALLWQFNRRRSAMFGDAESILTLSEKEKTDQPKAAPEQVKDTPNPSEQAPVFRSSFMSEFTPSDFDALGGEMEEVDPISEADVYLAYGRFKQAEDLILTAIEQHPERDDCRLKLLEIHFATENSQAFEKFAQELVSTHKESKPEFWEKIMEMGRELCPGNPLFQDGKPSGIEPVKLDTSTPASNQPSAENEIYLFNDEDGVESYDYPVTVASADGKPGKKSVEDAPATLPYDFSSTKEENADVAGQSAGEDITLPNIETFIAHDQDKTNPAEEEIVIPDESMEEMLAKLDALSESKSLQTRSWEKGQKEEKQEDRGHMAEELKDDGHFEENGMSIQPLEYMDELGTKLDLAKAYYDLGDAGAAREILQHVVRLGSKAQKEEAHALLEKLDGK